MFSRTARFVCSECHMKLSDQNALEKHKQKHAKITSIKKVAVNTPVRAKIPTSQEQDNLELPSPPYTPMHSRGFEVPAMKPKQSFKPPTKTAPVSVKKPEVIKVKKAGLVKKEKAKPEDSKNSKVSCVKKSEISDSKTLEMDANNPKYNVAQPNPTKLPSKVKPKKPKEAKEKFGNKNFQTTKKFSFFPNLANDIGNVSTSAIGGKADKSEKKILDDKKCDSEKKVLNCDSSQANVIDEIYRTPPRGIDEGPSISISNESSFDVQTINKDLYSGCSRAQPIKENKEPKKLNPGRMDCGDCVGCKRTTNCTECKFCLKPSLKKKCELRVCNKKLKEKISLNKETHNSLDGISRNVIEIEHEEPEDTPQRKLFRCSKCGKRFQFIKWLVNHSKKAECEKVKLMHCQVCDKLIVKDYFKKHIKTHTMVMVKCDLCDSSFKSAETLLAHKNAIHAPKLVTLNECDMCDKFFKHKSLLKQHVSKYHHTKEIECDECSMKFGTNGGLRRHKKQHTVLAALEIDIDINENNE